MDRRTAPIVMSEGHSSGISPPFSRMQRAKTGVVIYEMLRAPRKILAIMLVEVGTPTLKSQLQPRWREIGKASKLREKIPVLASIQALRTIIA